MNRLNLETLQHNIIKWGREKGLTHSEAATKQTLKMFSEAGELADNIIKSSDVRDDIGDVLVTLILLCEIKGTSFEECLNISYAEIADRKGVTLDGVFIKTTDPLYPGAVEELKARRLHYCQGMGAK